MAEFNASLPDPQRQFAPYGMGGGSDSAAAIAGGVLGGLGSIAGAYLKKQGQEQTAKEGNTLASQITDVVLDKASAGPPPLVGQGTGDAMTDAGAASSTGQGLKANLDRMGQAAQQGSMSEIEKLTRISALVQDAVNKDPIHADYFRALAKDTLGVAPTAEIFNLQNEASKFTQALSQDVYRTNVNAAAGAGITILDKNGQPDLQGMAAAGAKLLQTEKDADLKIKAATLAAAQAGTKMTHEEQVSQETNTAMGALNPVLEQVHGSMLNNLPALVAKYGAQGRDAAVAQLSVDLNNNQAQVMNYTDGFILKNKISPEAASKMRAEVRSMFDDYRTLFGDPKASLDQMTANAKILKNAQTLGQMNFRETMPVAARLKDVVGDQGIAALFAQNSILDPNVSTSLQNESHRFLAGKPSPVEVAGAATSAFTGDYDVAKEQRPAWQSAVTAGIVRTVNLLAKTPDKLTPEQQTAFGHSMVQIANTALNDKSPENLKAAASIVNNPSMVRTFVNFAKDPNNASHAPIVALGMSSLLYQHIASARRTLAQGEDILMPVTGSPLPQSQDPVIAGKIGFKPLGNINVQAGSDYNPQSGQVEFRMTATGPDGKPYKLSPQETQQAMQSFSQYRDNVNQVNRSLDALTTIKDYSPEGTKNYKPLEFRAMTISSAGIPVKEGMSLPKPTQAGGFAAGTDKLEGNNPAKNPKSSAEGYGQFVKGTWLSLAKEAFPDEIKGLTDNQILNLRKDRDFNDRMVEAYKMQNASKLEAAGIKNPDNAELYMAHHFGPEGAINIMKAPLRAPIESILPPDIIKVNPDLKGMTPLKLYQKYASAFTEGEG